MTPNKIDLVIKGFQKLIKSEEDPERKDQINLLSKRVQDAFDYLEDRYEAIRDKDKVSVDVEQRFITVVSTERKNPRFTYRPSTGELTVKIPVHYGEAFRKSLLTFAERALKEIPQELKMVIRGTPDFSKTHQKYRLCLTGNCHPKKPRFQIFADEIAPSE